MQLVNEFVSLTPILAGSIKKAAKIRRIFADLKIFRFFFDRQKRKIFRVGINVLPDVYRQRVIVAGESGRTANNPTIAAARRA